MEKKIKSITLGQSWFIVGVVVIVLISVTTFDNKSAPIKKDNLVEQANPVRFKVTKIAIDATVEDVGMTTSGEMDVPKNKVNVAWYRLGPRPGEIGSAVIAGHSGWINDEPAAFDNLHELRAGDRIQIETAKGEIIYFVVRELKTYDKEADASKVFESNDGLAHLNLITCAGYWDEVRQESLSRLVVFSDREDM